MTILIIGWGNPLAGDDGLGWAAAERVRDRLRGVPDVEVVATARGALRVAERMLGHDRVIVLDAAVGEGFGIVRSEIRPAEMDDDQPVGHDGTLHDAISALRRLGGDGLPERIVLLSVPIPTPRDWCDEVSDAASEAAAQLANAAIAELEGIAVG